MIGNYQAARVQKENLNRAKLWDKTRHMQEPGSWSTFWNISCSLGSPVLWNLQNMGLRNTK